MRKVLEEFIKAVLYAFPLMNAMDKQYQEHIKNKAVLSYKGDAPAEVLAEYIAQEILEKRRMLWLKERVQSVVDALNDLEKTLVAVRYFGKKRRVEKADNLLKNCSERTYFRMQQRLEKKLSAALQRAGITKALFDKWFLSTELFQTVYAYLSRTSEGISNREKKWLAQNSSCS